MDFQVHVMEEIELIFELNEIDRIPQVIYRVAPVYPYEMKHGGVAGSVSLMFICNTEGHVKNIEVRSASHRAFVEPTIRALRGWRFEPGIKDGHPVNVRMIAPFHFNPNNE
jgi:protein TonB